MKPERILFVTGRLAEPLVRRVVEQLGADGTFTGDVRVLGISVAALMHADWIARKLTIDEPYDRVILPGWCQGPVEALAEKYAMPFEIGPKDVRDLPRYFGKTTRPGDLSEYDVEIIAEINHAPRLGEGEILAMAESYRRDGADVIDLGCIPGQTWSGVGQTIRRLKSNGFRVSIDSFDREEVSRGVEAGAELVLSANSSNAAWLADLGAEVVAIPDEPSDLDSLDATLNELDRRNCSFRIDPIVEPIGFGFAASLQRYFECRRRYPQAAMMMGIGNLTEMTEVDSAGVNVLLAGVCQELQIHSVLTTQVINWARTAVREFDIARRLVRHAISERTVPKHLGAGLVMLRDEDVPELGEETLAQLAGQLTDPNYRIFVERGEIHVMNREGYWRGSDPYALFDQFAAAADELSPSHAFYLGYEMAKAVTALTLGKQYTQDEALRWGFLTVPEVSAHARRKAEAHRLD